MTKNVYLMPHFELLCMLPGIISMVTDIFLLQFFRKKNSIEQFRGENSFSLSFMLHLFYSKCFADNKHSLSKQVRFQ